MSGKHFFRIDRNERAGTARQNFAVGIADFSKVDVPPSVHALLRTSDGKRLAQRHGLEIFDFHGPGKRQHVAELVHLAHGLIQDGGDNAAVRVTGWTGVFAREFKVANGLAGGFVQ